MRIGFYGHSAASLYGDPQSFIDIVQKHFNAEIVNIGVRQGSQERIYYDLKKTFGKVDVAIIFHAVIGYSFIPGCNRDLSFAQVPSNKAKHLWREDSSNTEPVTPESFTNDFLGPKAKIKDKFGDIDTFVSAMSIYKEYFWDSELSKNRWECSLLGIDEFCSKNIPLTIHSMSLQRMPKWYPTFKSGIHSERLDNITLMSKPIRNPNQVYLSNNLSVAENQMMAMEIIKLITKNLI